MADDAAGIALNRETAEAQAVLGETRAPYTTARQGNLLIDVQLRGDTLWVVLCRDGAAGGLALRMPVLSPDARCRKVDADGALTAIECAGSMGTAQLIVRGSESGLEQVRATLRFTPSRPVSIGRLPRDLVPFGESGDPIGATVSVEATQRRLNTALVYFTMKEPDFGKILYVQNLTALNDYFNLTGSKPENAVAGEWPELGYRPPLNPDTGEARLPEGQSVTLYDTIVTVRQYPQRSEDDSAWQFLDMLAGLYPWLSPPPLEHRDWVTRSRSTIRDLMHAPEARIEHFGHTYFHPYTASEYPDVMVQLSLASALDEWGRWSGVRHPLVREILSGIDRFHDKELSSLRRYLPNVGPDKDADAVDSWYLYHPMLNLANVAIRGDAQARDLFLATIDYGIEAAHRFEYKWPIIFNMRDFSVIRAVTDNDQRGQTDVGGIYAWVMLQAFQLTLERNYLDEAIAAIEAAKGMRFDLNYQANLTAWGAAACIRLWRITDRKDFLTQSYVYLASFFHNAQMWESEIGLARHSKNFMGVTCLQDAPYMAAYECFDSFAAFEPYLDYGGPDLIPSVKLLVGGYCRYALDRAWHYYPDALPLEAVATENRNGYILRELSFPLEDLYPDDQQAGQVGQEIYGSGAAMVFATRSFHRIEGAPFLLFCDTLVRAIYRLDGRTVTLRLDGPSAQRARIALIPEEAGPDGFAATIVLSNGERLSPVRRNERMEAEIPADCALLLTWEPL